MKYGVILAFIAIIGSLALALVFMLKSTDDKEKSRSKQMALALALRVGISVLLFVSILLAWKLGYVHPSGIAPGQ